MPIPTYSEFRRDFFHSLYKQKHPLFRGEIDRKLFDGDLTRFFDKETLRNLPECDLIEEYYEFIKAKNTMDREFYSYWFNMGEFPDGSIAWDFEGNHPHSTP